MYQCDNLISGSRAPSRKQLWLEFGRILEKRGTLLLLLWLVHLPPCLHPDVVDVVWKTHHVENGDNARRLKNLSLCRLWVTIKEVFKTWPYHVLTIAMSFKSQQLKFCDLTRYQISHNKFWSHPAWSKRMKFKRRLGADCLWQRPRPQSEPHKLGVKWVGCKSGGDSWRVL